jgi:hypothetical protein
MRFVANLRNETIAAFAEQSIQPAGYLLSAHRISPAALASASKVRSLGLPLLADNGTKPLIDETIATFEERASKIRLEVRDIRKILGRIPRGNDVPDPLRKKASSLALDVVDHAVRVSEAVDAEALLQAQLSMQPTGLIAQEDFATACLMALNLEREITGWSISRFDDRNRRSLRLWRRVVKDPRCRSVDVFAVLSAIDYNTARSAGRLAAKAGTTHAAIGIAGITGDVSGVDFFVIGTRSVKIDKPVPRRYVRLAQIVRGFADGFHDGAGALASFHCLGLGAPALLPIPAAALDERTVITLDATSPIHDAARDQVLYDPEHEGDRASITEIVERIVNGGDWPFVSPFTTTFRGTFGHKPAKARAAWKEAGQPAITSDLLNVASPLTAAVPLFCNADAAIQPVVTNTRIAHNHWVIGQIAEAVADGRGRHKAAMAAFDRWLAKPESATTRGLKSALAIIHKP